MENICIRELGEKKEKDIFPQVPLLASFPLLERVSELREGGKLNTQLCTTTHTLLALREVFAQLMV